MSPDLGKNGKAETNENLLVGMFLTVVLIQGSITSAQTTNTNTGGTSANTGANTNTGGTSANTCTPTHHWILAGAKVRIKRGDYCAGDDHYCTGARYTHEDYNKHKYLSSGYMAVLQSGTNTILWEGLTDGWPEINACPGSEIEIAFLLESLDARIQVIDPNGQIRGVKSHRIVVPNADLWTTWKISNDANPLASYFANLFETAIRGWKTLKGYPEIVAGWPTPSLVILPANKTLADFDLGRIAISQADLLTTDVNHELGHIAEFAIAKAAGHPAKDATNYSYSGQSPQDHHWDSYEWKHTAYNESLANFVQARSMYYPSARNPRVSGGTGASTRGNSFEETGTCRSLHRRTEKQISKFLWDLYDTRDDGESVSYSFRQMFVAPIAAFPAGVDNHEVNEPFDSLKLIPGYYMDYDGHSIEDYVYHLGVAPSVVPVGKRLCLWGDRIAF